MARNGSGTHSTPNTLVASAVITASDLNENFSDIASELTNSVAKDGQTTMTGALKASNGTVAAPGITFGTDTDTGVYRIGADNVGVAVGGTKIVDIASTGATVTGSIDATTVKQGGFALVPAGVILDYAGGTAPDGFLFCYGQAVSRTTYAALFTALSTVYGTGDGSTTFNLPDCRGRASAGKDDMGGSSANRLTNQSGGLNGDTLGATGGEETHVNTIAEMAAHNHGGSTGTHTHNLSTILTSASSASYSAGATNTVAIAPGTGGVTDGNTATISSQGSGTAHNNVQPTIILNKIIKY